MGARYSDPRADVGFAPCDVFATIRSMNETDEAVSSMNDTHSSTPMGRVWSIVILSMCLVGAIAWGLHLYAMTTLRNEYRLEADTVRADIATLRAHVATFGTTTPLTSSSYGE